MESSDLVALVAAALLGTAHMVPPLLTFLRFAPRSWALSAAGGVSVSYVFVHLLPEVAEAQAAVREVASSGVASGLEKHAYLTALIGLVMFYGLERAAVTSAHRRSGADGALEDEPTSAWTFWLSVLSFAIYNAIIGYLLVRRAKEDSVVELVLFAAALGFHFVINDLGLRDRHRRRYDRFGRPLLVLAVFFGWLVGLVAEFSDAAIGLAVAFLAGGIILNVMKEEVPKERQSRFLPFASGAAAYTLVLLTI